MNSSSTPLDSCICQYFNFRHLAQHLSRHLYLSTFTNLLYNGSTRFPSHFSRSLSLDRSVLSPPKTLSLTPNLFPSVFQAFSSFSLHLVSFFSLIYMHFMFWNLGFRVFEKFWGFSKLLSFYWNFGMGCYLNEFKISCIASYKHYNNIIMHLDVCNLIVCW